VKKCTNRRPRQLTLATARYRLLAHRDLRRLAGVGPKPNRQLQVVEGKDITLEPQPPREGETRDTADDHSIYAVAQLWISRILTVSLEMVIPGLLGAWADRHFGTSPVWTLVGFGVGLPLGFWHLLAMTKVQK
jgi:hypothetical protein